MKITEINMYLVDKETGEKTNKVPIKKVIYNQFDIEFEFENGGTLPYKDFLMYLDDYDVVLSTKGDTQ